MLLIYAKIRWWPDLGCCLKFWLWIRERNSPSPLGPLLPEGWCSRPDYDTSDATNTSTIQQLCFCFIRLLASHSCTANVSCIWTEGDNILCHYDPMMQVPNTSLAVFWLGWISATYWILIINTPSYLHKMSHPESKEYILPKNTWWRTDIYKMLQSPLKHKIVRAWSFGSPFEQI